MISLPPGLTVESGNAVQFADWVELNALLDETANGIVSATEASDLLIADPPDEADAEMDPEGYRQAAVQLVEDAFGHVHERSIWLRECYPLKRHRGVVTPTDDCGRYDIYRFLVLLRARQLYPYALNDDGKLSGLLFEELATQAFGQYIGAKPEHRIRFGLAGGQRGSGLPSDLTDALEELSRRMNEGKGGNFFHGTGDFRADGIAWRAFGDDRAGQLVLMGQATISEDDWLQKQPAPRWSRLPEQSGRPIALLARPVTAVAFAETLPPNTPPVLEALGGKWVSIPFDRLRILSLLSDEDIPVQLREQINDWVDNIRSRL